MQLFVILLVVVSVFLLLIKLLGSFTGRLSERMVTNYFRSAEALLERDHLPPDWGEQLARTAKRGTARQRLIHRTPWREAAKPYLMKKINDLHKFFEKCPFVENPESRELLLSRLNDVIERWEESDLSEILRYYNVTVDSRN